MIETKNLKLKCLIAHALAVTNFSELSDHNDRTVEILEQGGDKSLLSYSYSEQADEDMRQEKI